MATPVIMPQAGNSVESCLIVQWLKQPGETVVEGEAVCEIETDKSTMEVEAPAAGVLIETFFAADDDVPVKTAIAAIGEAGEDVSALRPAGSAAEPTPAAAEPQAAAPTAAAGSATAPSAPVAAGDATGASPRARRLASEGGVDTSTLAGSGPRGRVIERDVQAAIQAGPTLSPAARAAGGVAPARGSGIGGRVLAADMQAASAAAGAGSAPAAAGGTIEIPVKGIRKVIAGRMRESLAGTAQLTLNASAKASAMQAYRARVKQAGEGLGLPNITLNDLILFALSRVLPRHPEANAHFLGDRIVQFADVNLGVAVDTGRGLMVPVLAQANHLSLAAISCRVKDLAKQAQAGGIDPDLLQGGTFTLTNLGALGIGHFTPVLNAPEVAILGVGGIRPEPYRNAEGGIDFIDSISLSLTIDHQALDGAPAARFLADLVQAIEHIDLVLAA
ncbi:MAG: dihydrolipoamide acetyltransferase family protein [Planctomycetota bacterium]